MVWRTAVRLDLHPLGALISRLLTAQRSNATITAEYIFLYQALGLELSSDSDELARWLLSDQKEDGSWAIASDGYPGDVSTTVEAYLALKILGIPVGIPAMRRARDFIFTVGGVAKVRVFTRIYLAMFGLFPWDATPALPAELILIPSLAPVSIYRFSSWARSTIVPLLLVKHHQPIYALPNGRTADNAFLDELWCDPRQKHVPYSRPLEDLRNFDGLAIIFSIIDSTLNLLSGLGWSPLRGFARRQCVKWILEHQEKSGDWAGIFPPMHLGLLALVLEGWGLQDSPVRRGL